MEALGDYIGLPDDDEDEEPEPALPAAPLPSESPPPAAHWTPSCRYKGTDPFLALHEDILDFVDAFAPSAHEHACRRESIEVVAAAVAERWPGAEAVAFGSYATGLYLPASDVDVALRFVPAATKRDKEETLRELATLLRARGLAREDAAAGFELEVIATARVPIATMGRAEEGM